MGCGEENLFSKRFLPHKTVLQQPRFVLLAHLPALLKTGGMGKLGILRQTNTQAYLQRKIPAKHERAEAQFRLSVTKRGWTPSLFIKKKVFPPP